MVAAFDSHVLRPPASGELAGRAAELDRLREAWSRAVAGIRQLVLLTGEGGVGKTRLATELASEAQNGAASVLVGSWPPAGAEPCAGLVEALGAAVVRGCPVGADRDAMFEAVATDLARRARRSPVLLVLDDLQRADRTSLLAIRYVLEAPGPSALLIVGAYRDAAVDRSHPLSEFLAALHDRPGVERVNLEGLSPGAVGELVGDAELGSRLWRQSEGSPLVVGELLRLGALDAPLPASFDELVSRRIARLGDGTGRVLEAAAVVGDHFSVPVLAAATAMAGAAVGSALREAAEAGLVGADPARPGAHRFVHDMVREAIERGTAPVQRVRLHLAVGRALDQLGSPPAAPAALAWHFRAGAPVGGSAQAVRHSALAGDRAMQMLAWDEAAGEYGHALAAAAGARPETRADLLLSLGEAQGRAGETARARQSFLEAAGVARRCRDGPRLARATLALSQVSAVWGADPVLDRLAGEARALLGRDAPVPAALLPRTDFASDSLYDVLDGAPTSPAAPAAPPAAPEEDPGAGAPAHAGRGAASILVARHRALAGPEHGADRLATADALVALASETGDDELAATGRGWRVLDLMEQGRVEEATADQRAHAEIAHRLGHARHRSDAAAWRSMRALLAGRVDEARVAADEALVLRTSAGDPEASSSFWIQRWAVALEWGGPGERVEVLDACGDEAAAAASPVAWRASLALLLARSGDLEPAAEELRRVMDRGLGGLVRDPRRLHALTCLAEVAWVLGDVPRAGLLAPLLEPFAAQSVVVGPGLAWLGAVARACGLAAARAHRWDDAARHLGTALAGHRRAGALPLLARTHYEWAQVLTERGRRADRRRAAESLRKSQELAARLKMDGLLR